MKLGVFLLLIPATIAFLGLSSLQVWLANLQQPFKNLVENPRRRSVVPQFILDTRHPWIVANQRKLERLPYAEAFLCFSPDLGSKVLTETETGTLGEGLEVPSDLFDKLEINNNRAGVSRPGWPNALERLGEIKQCQRALDQVKTLEVDVFVHRGKYVDLRLKLLEPSQPPAKLLTLSGDVLESMTNLERLQWGIPKEDTHFFENAFKARNLTLPSIKHLEPGPSSHYLVGMCPNLESLENGGGYNWYHGDMPDGRDWGLVLIRSAASMPGLKRFAMKGVHDGWNPTLVSEVVKSMPQIESLGLRGSLGGNPTYMGNSGELKAVVDGLIPLNNLTHLDLPDSSGLGLGFDGGPTCGNVYMGKGGSRYLRQVIKEGAEATEQGGDIVIASLPHLTGLTIGGDNANITRTQEGTIDLTWPWTGRMDEWLMEVAPDRTDLWDDEYESM
ncbi:hypothetical protein MMC25_001415 [Agyrium rufum]|nr:hypothetical protein [Agyrium rufum]